MMKTIKKDIQAQEGNVLFLILIAVALFAALSYAVTQSSRGGNNASKETNILNSAQITQYPTQVRTAVLRMMIDGNDPANIMFNTPADFNTLSTDGTTRLGVFHPRGGEAVYQQPASGLVNTTVNSDQRWFFNGNFEIGNIGLPGTGEIIAFLPGISSAMCTKLNEEYGITDIPEFGSDVLTQTSTANSTNVDSSLGSGTDSATNATSYDGDLGHIDFPSELDGQPFGCFENDTASGEYVYYHVLVER